MDHKTEDEMKKICRYFTSFGGCRFGANCWFYHPTAQTDRTDDPASDQDKENQVPRVKCHENKPSSERHSIICKCGGKVLEDSECLAIECLTNHVFELYLRLDRNHLNVLNACLAAMKPQFRMLSCKVCTHWTNNNSVKIIRHYCQRAQGNSKHSEDHRIQLKEFCKNTINIFKEENNENVQNTKELSKLMADLSMKESSTIVQSFFESLLIGDSEDSDSDSDCGILGFSADEVQELLCQGIKPWDPEAGAALSILYDYDDFY